MRALQEYKPGRGEPRRSRATGELALHGHWWENEGARGEMWHVSTTPPAQVCVECGACVENEALSLQPSHASQTPISSTRDRPGIP